jgi:hypothetical protein
MIETWQVEYSLYIKFACTYLQAYNAIPDTIEYGFLTTVYGGSLKEWALEHMKELTSRASKLRNGRKLDDSVIKELKSLDGYRQLIKLMKG